MREGSGSARVEAPEAKAKPWGFHTTYLGGHVDLGQADEGAGARVARDGARGQDGDEDDEVHDVGEGHEAGVLVGDDKGRGVGAGAAEEVLVVGADGDGDHEGAHEVEEAEADPDGVDGLGDGAARVGGLGGDEAARLGAGHGEDAGGHDVEEALEAVGEAARLVPVAEPDAPALGRAAGRDDDHGDDDDEDPAELDGGEDDLGLGEVVDGADVDEHDDDEEDGDPPARGHLGRAVPEAEHRDEAGELVGDGDEVLEEVAPAQREARRRADELVCPLHEGRGERIQDGHLADGVRHGPDHGPGEEVLYDGAVSHMYVLLVETLSSVCWNAVVLTADEQGRWTTVGQTRAAAQPETHSDGRAQGDHGDVPAAQASLELTLGAMVDDDVPHGHIGLLRCGRHRLAGRKFVAGAHGGLSNCQDSSLVMGWGDWHIRVGREHCRMDCSPSWKG